MGPVEDGAKVGAPVTAEEQIVVGQLLQLTPHAGHDQHGANAGVTSGEIRFRVGPQLGGQ